MLQLIARLEMTPMRIVAMRIGNEAAAHWMKTHDRAALGEMISTTAKAIHNEVVWHAPLGDGNTLMITILNVGLGSDIPC